MVGKALPLRKGPRGIALAKYRFMPDSSWREGIGATGSIGGINSMTFYADLVSSDQSKQWAQRESLSTEEVDRYFDTRVAEIDRIAIAFPSRDEFVLPLGPMAKPYDDLQACTRELARGWGYDPAVLNNLRNGPRLQNSEEISTFVIDALRKAGLRYADAIHYRLAIDERGAIAGCVVQYPKRTDATETTVCALLKDKARFEPAMDGDGNPVRAPSVSRIVFGL
jgi:hypothetical protein